MQSILSDKEILIALDRREIEIDPFVPEHVNITSYDLTLGEEVRVYSRWTTELSTYDHPSQEDGRFLYPTGGTFDQTLDVKDIPETRSYRMSAEKGWILKPGIGYLMHTHERVFTTKFNPILDGKSSIGRLFIQVHATAGYGDPGFNGQYTLEVIVQHPVRVYPGMRFCQIRFHTIEGPLGKTYDQVGHYTATQAQGAVPSQAWRQFT